MNDYELSDVANSYQLPLGASCPINLKNANPVSREGDNIVLSLPLGKSQLEAFQRVVALGRSRDPDWKYGIVISHPPGLDCSALYDLTRALKTCSSNFGDHLDSRIKLDRIYSPSSVPKGRIFTALDRTLDKPSRITDFVKGSLAGFFANQRRRTPEFKFETLEPRVLF